MQHSMIVLCRISFLVQDKIIFNRIVIILSLFGDTCIIEGGVRLLLTKPELPIWAIRVFDSAMCCNSSCIDRRLLPANGGGPPTSICMFFEGIMSDA